MNTINLKEQNYIIENVEGFTLLQYCKLMKTLYTLKEVYIRENKIHPELEIYMMDNWDSFEEVTITEAFKEENQEKKRIYFFCLKPERIFKKIKSKLISEVTLNRKGLKNKKEYSYEDTYKLFQINCKELGIDDSSRFSDNLYYVQCKCNSTGRDYYIWVDECDKYNGYDYLLKKRIYTLKDGYDAIDAICWTLRTPVIQKAVECFYRQGDVLITKIKEEYVKNNYNYLMDGFIKTRPLTKEEYINKLILQS
jgi:hypothetical protein